MRPSILNPLFAAVTALSGIGDKGEKLYRRLFGRDDVARVVDLLFHLPTGAIDRRTRTKLFEIVPGTVATAEVVVEGYRAPPPNRPQAPYLVYTGNDTGTLTIAYFSARRDYIEKLFPIDGRRCVSGMVTSYDGMLQMVHPHHVVEDPALMPAVEPVYGLTEGLTASMLRKALATALGTLRRLPEWRDADAISRAGWPDFVDALGALHRPLEPAELAPDGKAWSRLAYDELMAFQLELALERAHRPGGPRRAIAATPDALSPGRRITEKLLAALPFRLTASQDAAIADIAAHLQRPERMLRLLQGDVG